MPIKCGLSIGSFGRQAVFAMKLHFAHPFGDPLFYLLRKLTIFFILGKSVDERELETPYTVALDRI